MGDLNHLGRAGSRRRAEALLARFDLREAADRPAATYSGGMRRRLDLAMTLVGAPRILFLDEPTAGLDPRSRHTMWTIIRELVAGGVTVFLTTQYLEEADELADRVALLDRGLIVAAGTPQELKWLVGGGHIRLEFSDPAHAQAAALALGGVDVGELALQVPSDGSMDALRDVLDRLDGVKVERLSMHTPDLDDVFLALTGSGTP
jgi:ABC-2 type transport system ATP-binding protein